MNSEASVVDHSTMLELLRMHRLSFPTKVSHNYVEIGIKG